ncbi:MAG: alkanesulfonate monooxygenase SsuD [Candidatus Binatia bacterium]|jgi:alkanesulfonate monooxygenase SsuD/methylene tetrahydromethanopterin reductase-like flavin-dependent oxidoreductase (luciferase family)
MPTIPSTNEEREKLRPIGRNTERYQMMLEELRSIVILADELGIDAFSTTEHHFHTEGGEVSVNPVLLYADFAARTKNIMFAPMSIVLPTADPIRVAEDIAILDQLTKGRVAVAFARGYQKRWMKVLGQGGESATGQGDKSDDQNRDVYDEKLEIVRKAWTEDAFDHDGTNYQVPYPHKDGIEGWPASDWTKKYGADGEIDENNVIRKIGVVPRPYQEPHPPIWAPFTLSQKSLIDCARRGILPWVFEASPEGFNNWCKLYQAESAKAGFDRPLGQNIGAVRAITIGDTYDEAFQLAAKTTGYEYHNYFNLFGFGEVFRNPSDDPSVKPLKFKDEFEATKRMIEKGYQLCGTVDDVKKQIEKLVKCHGDGALEWISWNFFYQGTVPFEVQARQLELFTTKVWPEFKG